MIATLVRMPAISRATTTAWLPWRSMNVWTLESSWMPNRTRMRGPATRPIRKAQASPATANAQATAITTGRLKFELVAAAAEDATSSTISPEEGSPKLSPKAPTATPSSRSRRSATWRWACPRG